MPSVGFQIICRHDSSRLPGKILKKINDRPIIQFIIERLAIVAPTDKIVVSTSIEKSDDPIAGYCQDKGIKCFRGSLENVSLRFLNCAQDNNFDFTTRINGDNIFLDIDLLKKMVDITQSNKYDFISNVKNRTFPKGMSIEIVRTAYYKKRYRDFVLPGDFEHVTLNLYQHEELSRYFYFQNNICPEAGGIQLAIDTQEDFNLAEDIINHFKGPHINYGLKDIYHYYKLVRNESL